MPVVLPLRPSLSSYSFRSILAGDEYKFRVRWNRREQAFYFDVREISDLPVVFGVKIVLGAYMGREVPHKLFRQGVMAARIPQGSDRSNPRFDDTGVRVQVLYYTNDEVYVQIVGSLTGGAA